MEHKQIEIKPGELGRAVMPYSEVCIHMQVAGKRMYFRLLENNGYCAVQLLSDEMQMFSFPITTGEGGVYSTQVVAEDGSVSWSYYYYTDMTPEREA